MRVVFMGTPEFSCLALKALAAAGHEIICAYSQPPKPKGRGMEVQKQPVHLLAESLGIPVRHPLSLKTADEQENFAALNADVAVVVAYGLLLPKVILDAPKFGCINIHASLLPRWRGAAPIQRAIIAGDAETGVSIMQMDEGLDTGPVLSMQSLTISAQTTAASLHDELASLGAKMIVEVLANLPQAATPQVQVGVTYAKKIDKAEAHIDFNRPATEVARHIHGLAPFPGAWCMMNGARVKLLEVEHHPSPVGGRWHEVPDEGLAPGTILDNILTIACAQGTIRPLRLQREGKAAMSITEFLRGNAIAIGSELS